MRLRIADLDIDDDVTDEPTFEPMQKRKSFDDDAGRYDRPADKRKRSHRPQTREMAEA